MLIEKMTNDECLMFVRQMKFGRVACVREKQPYVVPIYFMPDDHYLYGFSAPVSGFDLLRGVSDICQMQLQELGLGAASDFAEAIVDQHETSI